MSIVATPSAPPLDLDIPNYHHTSSQVNFQQVAGIDGQKGTNEEQLNINPRLLSRVNASQGHQHSSSSKGLDVPKCIFFCAYYIVCGCLTFTVLYFCIRAIFNI